MIFMGMEGACPEFVNQAGEISSITFRDWKDEVVITLLANGHLRATTHDDNGDKVTVEWHEVKYLKERLFREDKDAQAEA